MKKFFISFLGALAGIWFSLFLLTIGVLMIIGVVAATGSKASSKEIKKGSYLTIDLTNGVTDLAEKPDPMQLLSGELEFPVVLGDIVNAIDLAATDDKIEGICLEGSGLAGLAQLQAIGEALGRFKAAAPE